MACRVRHARRWVITHRAPRMLVRGRDSRDVLRQYGFDPKWSASGEGWVLGEQLLPDITAIAELETSGYRVVHGDGSDCQHGIALRGDHRNLGVDPSEACP